MHDGHIVGEVSASCSVGDFLTEASLWVPSYLDGSSGTVHAPFEFWLLKQLRPKRIVKLGSHLDCSYFAACEAIVRLGLAAECVAVGEWTEAKVGPAADVAYPELRRRAEVSYGSIARVIRSSEKAAWTHFNDGTIDLLYLDAQHHDSWSWEDGGGWYAKLSDRAIVVVHGISGLPPEGLGMPSGPRAEHTFVFPHGLGLSVFALGFVAPGPLRALLCAPKSERLVREIQGVYARLGEALEDRYDAAQLQRMKDELTVLRQGNQRLAQIGAVATRVEANAHEVIEASMAARRAFEEALVRARKRLRRKTRAAKSENGGLGKRGRRKKPVRMAAQPRALAVPRTFRQDGSMVSESAPPIPNSEGLDSRASPRTAVLRTPRTETTADDLNDVERAMVQAVQHTREVGWLASAPAWRALWETRTVPTPVRIGKVLSSTGPIAEGFAEVSPSDNIPRGVRWCVYTTLFGGYDTLLPPRPPASPVDFICFSDRDFVAEGWKVVVIGESGAPPVRAAKKFKMQPFDFLTDYDASLYVDANTLISGDVGRFVERWCLHEPWVMWRHSSRCDIYDEAEAILVNQKCEPDPVLAQIDRYQREELPRRSGLVEAGFIWRSHSDDAVQACMRLWEEETSQGSPRDQLSLAYLMWKTGYRPRVFPEYLGNIRANPLTSIAQHRHAVGQGRSADRPSLIAGAVKRLVFAYAPQNRTSGSTVMRGEQLAGLLTSRLPAGYEVAFLPISEVPSNAVVVLTKGVMERISVQELERLRSRSIAVLGDFVDAQLRDELLPLLDVVWAASISSYRHLLRTNPSIQVDLVTHHVDPRVPHGNVARRFAAGYFGEMINAVRSAQIDDMIDFHPVNTKGASVGWIERLPYYALHYAVRPRVSSRVFKPFLKGFIAARCGSNILVDRYDGDAVIYLGDDYPYLLDRPDINDVVQGLEFAKATYGSAVWRQGLEMMRAVKSLSSDEHVVGEVAKSLSRF